MPAPAAGRAPRQLRHWPTWLLIAFGWTLARWPWSLQRRAGVALGALMRLAMIDRRRTAAANLAWCFPELDDGARGDPREVQRHLVAFERGDQGAAGRGGRHAASVRSDPDGG